VGAPVAHKSTFRPAPLGLGGCGKDAAPKPGPVVGTDLEALGRLIKAPAEVTHAEWQTGPMAEHGGDWWVEAVLDVPAGRMAALLPGHACNCRPRKSSCCSGRPAVRAEPDGSRHAGGLGWRPSPANPA